MRKSSGRPADKKKKSRSRLQLPSTHVVPGLHSVSNTQAKAGDEVRHRIVTIVRLRMVVASRSLLNITTCSVAVRNRRRHSYTTNTKRNKNQMDSHHEHQMDLPYAFRIESHIEHLLSEYDRLSTGDAHPQLWFLSATFLPVRHKRTNNIPIPLDRCLAYFDQFYVGLLPKLMSNFERKRHLQPLTYLYGDYPFTKKDKTYAPLAPNEKFNANQFRLYLEHPETNPHVHAVMLLPPSLI